MNYAQTAVESTYKPAYWGPYLSNREWGTVRKDCSLDGNCWNSVTFERANCCKDVYYDWEYDGLFGYSDRTGKDVYYDWEYDGLFGYSDRTGQVCMSLALWNGKDPILKERLFGLSGPQGNHGEDIKELLYYLEGTPDHSFMRALYKYPQREYPYMDLVQESESRDVTDPEYEITDTGLFDENEYFDVEVTYATDKSVDQSLICCYTITNKSDSMAPITIIPKFWKRKNDKIDYLGTSVDFRKPEGDMIQFGIGERGRGHMYVIQFSKEEEEETLEFVINERHIDFAGAIIKGQYKNMQAITDSGWYRYVNAAVYRKQIPSQTSCKIYWTLYPKGKSKPFSQKNVEQIIASCQEEAQHFHSSKISSRCDTSLQTIIKQAYAGLLWNKQLYNYSVNQLEQRRDGLDNLNFAMERSSYPQHVQAFVDRHKITKSHQLYELAENLDEYLKSHAVKDSKVGSLLSDQHSLRALRKKADSRLKKTSTCKGNDDGEEDEEWSKTKRNTEWQHMDIHDILSVPDKWEFPWFASWDTAFQMVPFVTLHPEFTKHQLNLFLEDRFMHPSGQLPGCEWDFSDPNPPLHAWSCLNAFKETGESDYTFLSHAYEKLQRNYNWWMRKARINRKHLFTGGFLGMDNISVVDRSQMYKKGTPMEQTDATGWMALYSLNMLEMSLRLLSRYRKYPKIPLKHLNDFLDIAEALNRTIQNGGLWHPHEKFYYDVVETPSGNRIPINVRSLVGIVPLFACLNLDGRMLKFCPKLEEKLNELHNNGSLFIKKKDNSFFLSAIPEDRVHILLQFLLDEEEFLSPFGIRSLSKVYEEPYTLVLNEEMQKIFKVKEGVLTMGYTPGESDTKMFGGNSNWRGPIWICMNYMIVEALEAYHKGYGEEFKLVFQPRSFEVTTFNNAALEVCRRIVSLFTVSDSQNQRPCHGTYHKYQEEWRDLLQFYEYFHAETGRGCGASHQTGWTALIVNFIEKLKNE